MSIINCQLSICKAKLCAGGFLISIVIAILVFSLIVLLHELGHFVAARLTGVKVNEFALGMGPKLLKIQKGETLYTIRAIPMGGFCAMEGEERSSEDTRAYYNKAVWKRAVICAAGAFMNLVLGFLLCVFLNVQSPAYASTTIKEFAKDASTAQSGLQVGDKVVSVNNNPVVNASDMMFSILRDKDADEGVNIVVKRDGKKVPLTIKFDCEEVDGRKVFIRDFNFVQTPKNFFTVISESFLDGVSFVKLVWFSLVDLVTGQVSANEMSGPIGVTGAISDAVSAGETILEKINSIVYMVTLITINLGVFNLLPLPALDGGKLIFLALEAIRRKPVKPEHEGYVHLVGFALLIAMMIFVTFNDIVRLIKR